MELLGGDAHFAAQTELPAVGEAGGGVDVHGGGVHLVQKPLGVGIAVGDNGLAVPRAVGVAEVDGLVKGVHHLHGKDIVPVLRVPVLLCSGYHAGAEDLLHSLVPPQLHCLFVQPCLHHGQEPPCNSPVYQQALHGVAHAGAGAFGVIGDVTGHGQIGAVVHIGVADPLPGADDGDGGAGGHGTNQPPPPSGNQHVQIGGEVHQLSGAVPAGVLHQ